jgi:DNA-binding transcriptional ArsR family regulator
MSDNGQKKDTRTVNQGLKPGSIDDFVLDKGIFSNIFEKDIRRVYIYKKSERLAKAIHLVAPAFTSSPALRNRIDAIAVGLVDAAILPPISAREALSRELLALSSVLAIARVGGLLSAMNAEMIAREAHALLAEIATYEEPRLFLDDAPSLAALLKTAGSTPPLAAARPGRSHASPQKAVKDIGVGIKDIPSASGRRDSILAVLNDRGPSYIKDISTVIRDVSEKTIQRELAALVSEGIIERSGERRWSRYSLAAS